MADSPLRAKGRAMRRNLMGAAYADKLDRQLYTDPIMEKFAALTRRRVWLAVDETRARPQDQDADLRRLRHRNRADPELKLHIRFARNHGWAEDELVEAILHLLGYVGAPLVREALLAHREGDLCGDDAEKIRSRHNGELAALGQARTGLSAMSAVGSLSGEDRT